MQNNPAFGKYARTYPTKKLHMIVISITFAKSCYGTPGTKTTVCYMAKRIIKAVDHPMMTIVIRYIYTPKIINKTPITSIAMV